MFDEDKINELLRGASSKKKTSSKRKEAPQKKGVQKKENSEPTPTKTKEITQKELDNLTFAQFDEDGIGELLGAAGSLGRQKNKEEKRVSPKRLHNRQEYIHEQKLAEDRLRRLKQAEKRIEELERERRETTSRIAEEQAVQFEKTQKIAQQKITAMQEQLDQLQEKFFDQEQQLQSLQKENKALLLQCVELQEVTQKASQQEQNSKDLAQVFQAHGLHSDEYQDVMLWLIKTGIFPISYIKTDRHELLLQILHDKCHIQAANIPLPKESNDLYIDVPAERCPLSGGYDIMEQARLFKDECLINGYTTIVMFGTQGGYEPLFQVLFAHHALRITLSPAIDTLATEDIEHQIQANQLSFAWGDDGGRQLNYISNKKTVGEFLHDLVSYLRSLA